MTYQAPYAAIELMIINLEEIANGIWPEWAAKLDDGLDLLDECTGDALMMLSTEMPA